MLIKRVDDRLGIANFNFVNTSIANSFHVLD